MPTFLDVGLLEHFSVIFPFLLVFLIIYGLLSWTKTFGDNKGLHALIALSLAAIAVLIKGITDIINFMAPWFVIFFVFSVLLLMAYKFYGAKDEDIASVLRTNSTAAWGIFAIGVIIVVLAISNVYGPVLLGQSASPNVNATGPGSSFEGNVKAVLFHPKVLGAVFILIVAAFTIRLIAGKLEEGK